MQGFVNKALLAITVKQCFNLGMKPNLAVIGAIELIGSQAFVAKVLGVSAQAVNQWVKGARPVPRKQAIKLSRLVRGCYSPRDLSPKHFDDDEDADAEVGIGGVSAPANTPEAIARALAARGIQVRPEAQPPASAPVSPEECDPDAGRIVPFEELP